MTGHVRKGSDIDLHVFCDSRRPGHRRCSSEEGYQYDVERKQVVKHGEARVFTHIHVYDRFNFELTVYAEDKAHYVFKSSITGKAIERASIRELEELLRARVPRPRPRRRASTAARTASIPIQLFRLLLLPLEKVQADRRSTTPRATCSTTRCRSSSWPATQRPYDEEFLLAALLHDVGKGIDPADHVGGAVAVCVAAISELRRDGGRRRGRGACTARRGNR